MSTSEYVDMLLKGRKQMISYLEYLEMLSIFDLAEELEDNNIRININDSHITGCITA
jgi:hypothetical protein